MGLGSQVRAATDPATQGSFLVQPPALGPLQDDGGPSWTHALLPGSPAIDHAPTCTYDDDLDPQSPEVPLRSDPRGWNRPAGAACDSGAYEVDSFPLPRVVGHRVLDCTAQQAIATPGDGESFTVDLADVARPACPDVGVLLEANAPAGDGSVGHDYVPAPAPGESVPPLRRRELRA